MAYAGACICAVCDEQFGFTRENDGPWIWPWIDARAFILDTPSLSSILKTEQVTIEFEQGSDL